MSITPRPPIPTFIPESAPFTPEQRTWLNGLFAGLFGLQESVTPLSDADAAKLLGGLIGGAVQPAAEPEDDGAPWHDPAMPLPDRMKLAEEAVHYRRSGNVSGRGRRPVAHLRAGNRLADGAALLPILISETLCARSTNVLKRNLPHR